MASENGQEKRETLADIVAEIRDEAARADTEQYYGLDDAAESMREYAERIEAIDSADAWRSLYEPPVGNAAALREAMEFIKLASDDYERYGNTKAGALDVIYEKACAALSKPPRNCDVGTPDEQAERFGKLCGKFYNEEEPCNEKCPLASLPIIHGFPRCQAYWEQAPYTAEKGGAE